MSPNPTLPRLLLLLGWVTFVSTAANPAVANTCFDWDDVFQFRGDYSLCQLGNFYSKESLRGPIDYHLDLDLSLAGGQTDILVMTRSQKSQAFVTSRTDPLDVTYRWYNLTSGEHQLSWAEWHGRSVAFFAYNSNYPYEGVHFEFSVSSHPFNYNYIIVAITFSLLCSVTFVCCLPAACFCGGGCQTTAADLKDEDENTQRLLSVNTSPSAPPA